MSHIVKLAMPFLLALLPGCGVSVCPLRNPTELQTACYVESWKSPSGILDTSFGTQGYVLPNFGGTDEKAIALKMLTDNSFLVLGYTNQGGILDLV